MNDKEVTVIEFNPETDTVLILREDGIEFMYPGRNTADGDDYVDPYILPITALAMLYGTITKAEEDGVEVPFEEDLLLNILHAYIKTKVEELHSD